MERDDEVLKSHPSACRSLHASGFELGQVTFDEGLSDIQVLHVCGRVSRCSQSDMHKAFRETRKQSARDIVDKANLPDTMKQVMQFERLFVLSHLYRCLATGRHHEQLHGIDKINELIRQVQNPSKTLGLTENMRRWVHQALRRRQTPGLQRDAEYQASRDCFYFPGQHGISTVEVQWPLVTWCS
jgi:hypothetical protein